MITIILILVGIFLLFKEQVDLFRASELRKPNTIILGAITIVAGILAMVIGRMVDPQSKTDVVVYVAAFIIPLIAISFLKQPKLQTTEVETKTSTKAVNIIGWVVLLGVVGFLIWLMFNISEKPAPITSKTIMPAQTVQNKPVENKVSNLPQNFQIKEWGVNFNTPTGLQDLVYFYSAKNDSVSFSSKTLMALDKETAGSGNTYCDPANDPVGTIFRQKNKPNNSDPNSKYIDPSEYKEVDGYFYTFVTPQATCSDNKSVQKLTEEIRNGLVANWRSLTK